MLNTLEQKKKKNIEKGKIAVVKREPKNRKQIEPYAPISIDLQRALTKGSSALFPSSYSPGPTMGPPSYSPCETNAIDDTSQSIFLKNSTKQTQFKKKKKKPYDDDHRKQPSILMMASMLD